MRLYNGRFLRKSVERRISEKAETRDAVIHSVDLENRWVGVRVQGSNKTVRAWYPDNWEKIPYWLKVGNVVRIQHCGGIRGRVEILGCGILRPVPISGGSEPTPPADEDVIVSGLNTFQVPEGDWMRIMVKVGYIRISGAQYYLDAVPLGGDNYVLGMGGNLNEIAYVSPNITAPSAGNYRYVSIAVGSDLAFDVIYGSQFTTTPVLPTIPADHFEVGRILTYGGMTSIKTQDIGASYATPVASSLTMTIADDDLAWAETSTTVTVTVKDQYGNAINGSGSGWYITLAITNGGDSTYGTISYGGSSGISVSAYTGSGSQIAFTYTRNKPGTEHSPQLKATMNSLSAIGLITLRDESGNMIV